MNIYVVSQQAIKFYLYAFPMGSRLTCRLEIPTAVMTPNITRNMPPITGVGMVANAAPIFPRTPIRSSTQPAATITDLLPTCGTQGDGGQGAECQPRPTPPEASALLPGASNNTLALSNPQMTPLCSHMGPGKGREVTAWQLNIQVGGPTQGWARGEGLPIET